MNRNSMIAGNTLRYTVGTLLILVLLVDWKVPSSFLTSRRRLSNFDPKSVKIKETESARSALRGRLTNDVSASSLRQQQDEMEPERNLKQEDGNDATQPRLTEPESSSGQRIGIEYDANTNQKLIDHEDEELRKLRAEQDRLFQNKVVPRQTKMNNLPRREAPTEPRFLNEQKGPSDGAASVSETSEDPSELTLEQSKDLHQGKDYRVVSRQIQTEDQARNNGSRTRLDEGDSFSAAKTIPIQNEDSRELRFEEHKSIQEKDHMESQRQLDEQPRRDNQSESRREDQLVMSSQLSTSNNSGAEAKGDFRELRSEQDDPFQQQDYRLASTPMSSDYHQSRHDEPVLVGPHGGSTFGKLMTNGVSEEKEDPRKLSSSSSFQEQFMMSRQIQARDQPKSEEHQLLQPNSVGQLEHISPDKSSYFPRENTGGLHSGEEEKTFQGGNHAISSHQAQEEDHLKSDEHYSPYILNKQKDSSFPVKSLNDHDEGNQELRELHSDHIHLDARPRREEKLSTDLMDQDNNYSSDQSKITQDEGSRELSYQKQDSIVSQGQTQLDNEPKYKGFSGSRVTDLDTKQPSENESSVFHPLSTREDTRDLKSLHGKTPNGPAEYSEKTQDSKISLVVEEKEHQYDRNSHKEAEVEKEGADYHSSDSPQEVISQSVSHFYNVNEDGGSKRQGYAETASEQQIDNTENKYSYGSPFERNYESTGGVLEHTSGYKKELDQRSGESLRETWYQPSASKNSNQDTAIYQVDHEATGQGSHYHHDDESTSKNSDQHSGTHLSTGERSEGNLEKGKNSLHGSPNLGVLRGPGSFVLELERSRFKNQELMDNTSRPRSDNDSLNRRLIRHQIKSSALKETPAPEKYVEPSAADQNESFDTASVLRQVLMPSIEKNSGNVDSADIMLDEISEDENFRRLSEGYKAETTIDQMEDSMAEQRRLYFEEQRKLRKHVEQN